MMPKAHDVSAIEPKCRRMKNDPRTHGLWERSAPPAPATAPLAGDLAVDVAVVGAGFTGLSAALHLAEAGASVAVLEGVEIGYGGSGRNVGLVNAGLWVMPDSIPAVLGVTHGRRILDLLGNAPAVVFDLVERHGIDCEAERRGTLHCGVGAGGFKELRERARQWQAHGAPVGEAAAETPAVTDADLAWRLARKNVHIAFSNFAEAFYRMMSEPKSHQVDVPELNNLLIQNHVLASQITAAIPILAALPATPEPIKQALDGMTVLLDESSPRVPLDLPTQFDTAGDQAALVYPVKQMLKATHMIRQELLALADPLHAPPMAAAAS